MGHYAKPVPSMGLAALGVRLLCAGHALATPVGGSALGSIKAGGRAQHATASTWGAVLQRLGHVLDFDLQVTVQIGHGACHPQAAVGGPARPTQALRRAL